MREGRDLTPRYAAILVFYWVGFSAVMAFTSAYLLNIGISNAQIGLVIACGGAVSAVLQPVLSTLADKPNSPSLKIFILIFCGLMALSGLLILFFGRAAHRVTALIPVTAVFYGATIMLLQLLQPFLNALGMESINHGDRLNFGLARGISSLGYAAASYGFGILVNRFSPDIIPVGITTAILLLAASLLLYPFSKYAEGGTGDAAPMDKKTPSDSTAAADNTAAADDAASAKDVRGAKVPGASKAAPGLVGFFKKYPRFGIVLLGCVCIYFGHTVLNSYTLQIVTAKGGGSAEMGTATAIAALVELPTLFFFSVLVRKVRCDLWFRLSGIFFTLKVLFSLLAANVLGFYFVQVFQMGGWALMAVSIVYYVNALMAREDVIKGQGYASLSYSIGSVTGSLLGGFLLDAAGVNVMLIITTIISTVGMVVLFVFAERTESINREH